MDRVIYESSKRITCKFNGYPGHKGVDLGYRSNEEYNKVYANCKGVVEAAVDGLDTMPITAGSWGNYVLVKHQNGMYTRYCHLRKGTVKVKRGQTVDENIVLGIIGESGSVQGRHLHFEVQKTVSASTRIDPTQYLTKPVWEEPKQEVKPVNNSNEVVYTVVANDTLISIAKRYNTTVDSLVKLNNIANSNLIIVGQKIKIKESTSVQRKYTVKPGDTVSAICSLFYKRSTKTEWDKIKNANNLNSSYLIKTGQTLIIP